MSHVERKRFNQFCEHLVLCPVFSSLSYRGPSIIQSYSIDNYRKIEAAFPVELGFVSAFCMNIHLQESADKSKISNIQEQATLKYWIDRGDVSRINYAGFTLSGQAISEAVIAIAKGWLFIALLKNDASKMHESPKQIVSRQIIQCIEMARQRHLAGVATMVSVPELYSTFLDMGFHRGLDFDTGLPIPFSLSLR